MSRFQANIMIKWKWLMFFGISLFFSGYVFSQNDSTVVGINFSSHNVPIQYNAPVFIRSDFDSAGKVKSFKTSSNPDSYLPGTRSTYSYDAQSRLIIKDSLHVSAAGVSTLSSHESFGYSNSGAITHHMFYYQGWSDSTVYLKDDLLRDSINVRYVNSLVFPKWKTEYFYQGSSLTPAQIVESSFDSVLNIWIPNVQHHRYFTAFDSLEIDSAFQYNTITHVWDRWKVIVNTYSVSHYLINSQDYLFLNGFYSLNSCRNYFYNNSSQLVKFDEYAGSCGGYLMYHYEWSYNALGDLISYLGMQNLSSLNCGWFTLSYYQYIRDSLGKVVEANLTDNQPGVPCSGSSSKKEFYFTYADKGKWSVDLVVPNSSVTHCEDDTSVAYLLSLNAPSDALIFWKVNDIINGSGHTKVISLKENLVLSAFSSSVILGDSVFSSDVHFNVLGKSSLPILSNGLPDDIKKCDNSIVDLKTDSIKLNNPSWYLNGSLLGAYNGKFSIPANQQGVYTCQSKYIHSPFCLHSDMIYVQNISPHPLLISDGSNITNLLTVISDDSFDIGNTYDWYKNGSYLFATYDGKLNVSSPGTYYCKVTNKLGCQSSSSNLVVNLYKSIGNNDGVWFANPVIGNQVTLSFDLSIWPLKEDIRFTVYDLQGRLIAKNNISSQDEIILLPHGSAEYFISFYKGNQMQLVKKLLVVDQ